MTPADSSFLEELDLDEAEQARLQDIEALIKENPDERWRASWAGPWEGACRVKDAMDSKRQAALVWLVCRPRQSRSCKTGWVTFPKSTNAG